MGIFQKTRHLRFRAFKKEEFEEILNISLRAAETTRSRVAEVGIDNNEDGKFEFALSDDRKLMLVDSVGTPDECRFTVEGIPLSKEIARMFYRKTAWYDEIEEAKKKDSLNWRSLTKRGPEKLLKDFLLTISNIYRTLTNTITGKEFFTDSPDLQNDD